MSFEHKGITITVDRSGKFNATVGTQKYQSTSLEAIKRKLDAAKKVEPKPGLIDKGLNRNHSDHYEVVTVVGTVTRGRTFRKDTLYVTDTGRELSTLYEDTPEARATIVQMHEDWTAYVKARDELDKKARDARSAHLAKLPKLVMGDEQL